MPVSLKFNTQSTFLNGAVSTSSNPSIDNTSAANVFSDTFSALSAEDIAKKMFLGKNELNYETDFSSDNSGVVTTLQGRLETLQTDLTNASDQSDIDRLENEIERLTNEINQKSALIDTTRALNDLGDITGDNPSSEVYNPDFPINSVSFNYSQGISNSNRSNPVDRNARGPNVGFPNGNNSVRSADPDAGFGNVSNEGTIQDSYLDSIQIIRKYQD